AGKTERLRHKKQNERREDNGQNRLAIHSVSSRKRKRIGNRVEPAAAQRMTAGEPPRREPQPFQKPMAKKRLLGVRRAARHIAAMRSQQRRNALLVRAQEGHEKARGPLGSLRWAAHPCLIGKLVRGANRRARRLAQDRCGALPRDRRSLEFRSNLSQ